MESKTGDSKINIGIFTTVTNAKKRGDNPDISLKCYEDLADDLVVIDGKKTWPDEFTWPLIGQHFQKGYEQLKTDWVIHADLDFIFHERDYGRIRQALKDYPKSPAVSFYKWQFILPDRYNLKSRLVIAVNKGVFGDRIKFNGGGDLCQPTLDGVDMNLDEIPQAGVPFYNYEKLTKESYQIADDVGRMDRAYFRHFGKYMYGQGDDLSAFDGWLHMAKGRFNKPQKHIGLHEHPKVIQNTIEMLTPLQFGYDGFGLLERNDYVKSRSDS